MTKFYPSEEVFGLPNIKSAKKRVLVNQTKAARNKAATTAVKAVDQAAARGLLHKNTAANRKSKMTLRLNKIPQ